MTTDDEWLYDRRNTTHSHHTHDGFDGAGTERLRADGLEVELCGATGACNSAHTRVTEAPDVMLVDLVCFCHLHLPFTRPHGALPSGAT